jgi:Yip1 domain
MPTAHLFADTLVAPSRGLAAAAARRSIAPPLVAATAVTLLVAALLVPRLDYQRTVDALLEREPQAAAQLTPHDHEVALQQAEKLGGVTAWAAGLLTPALRALGIAIGLAVAFRAAAAPAQFAPTLAIAAWGTLPLALRELLSIPAILRMQGVGPEEVERALPSSLAALLPDGASPPVLALAGAFDLFTLWSLTLVALGMAGVAGVSRRRALAVVLVLWGSGVLLVRVALPGFTGGR